MEAEVKRKMTNYEFLMYARAIIDNFKQKQGFIVELLCSDLGNLLLRQ